MITQEQIERLSKLYAIDGFTIMREYLQLIFLSYLYQQKEGKEIYFKGGTAIRLLFDSPRFSEDLDFSTFYNKKQITKIIKSLEKSIQQELPELRVLLLYSGKPRNSELRSRSELTPIRLGFTPRAFWLRGKETTRFRIKYQSTDFKYPLIIRLDFHHVKKMGKTTISPLITKFPIVIFPLISHLSEESILEEKIDALMTRSKGRDFFDVWFLLEKGISAGKNIDKELILNKIERYSQAKLNHDLAQFLPKSQRAIISLLKERLQNKFRS